MYLFLNKRFVIDLKLMRLFTKFYSECYPSR